MTNQDTKGDFQNKIEQKEVKKNEIKNEGEKEKRKGQRQKRDKGGGGKEEHNKTEILKTTEIPKIGGNKANVEK